MKDKILVTGANGFLGLALATELMRRGGHVLGTCRKAADFPFPVLVTESLSALARDAVLHDVATIVHCAARVHVMADAAGDPLSQYRAVNVNETMALAAHAAAAGVRRFIFISSVKVNGEHTLPEQPFTEACTPQTQDPYGVSKLEAEQALLALAAHSDMEVVIVRPPLIYGPGVKANFASMMRLVERQLPLPLGRVCNKRSLVALGNMIDFIDACIRHPAAANQTFLVSDGEDVSTTELLHKVAAAAGVKSRLIPVPVWLMTVAATLLGKRAMADRLFGSLQIDGSKARQLLGWTPPISLDEGLRRCFNLPSV